MHRDLGRSSATKASSTNDDGLRRTVVEIQDESEHGVIDMQLKTLFRRPPSEADLASAQDASYATPDESFHDHARAR
jgi:hypothetical protein